MNDNNEHHRFSEGEESIFEKVIGEGWKERVKGLVGEFKLPKEALTYILKQVDETKHATVGIVSKEVRAFLENADLADEIAKVLTKVSLEITTHVKFTENDGKNGGIKISLAHKGNEETPAKKQSGESKKQ